MTEGNTALLVTKAQQALDDLQRKGRGLSHAEVLNRTRLEKSLSNIPVFLVAVDNTGSFADDLIQAQNVVQRLMTVLPPTHIKFASFGDLAANDQFAWIQNHVDLNAKGNGGGNRHENSLEAVTHMMSAFALGMLGLPGYSYAPRNNTSLPEKHGPVTLMLLTDEYPHAAGVTRNALIELMHSYQGGEMDSQKIDPVVANFNMGNIGNTDISTFVKDMKIANIPLHVYAPKIEDATYTGLEFGQPCPELSPLTHLGTFWEIVAKATKGKYTPLNQMGTHTFASQGLRMITDDVISSVLPVIHDVQKALPPPSAQPM